MRVNCGTYVGNGSDNRSITGAGFQPDFVMVVNSTAAEGATRYGTQTGDNSFPLRDYDPGGSNWPPQANKIQAMESDGFQVGTASAVNSNGVTYYWIALKDDGESNICQSTYAGGAGNNITGSGFDPQFVLTKGEWDWSGAGTLYHDGWSTDKSLILNTGGFTADDRVEALITDGFRVGGNEYANRTGYTYHYITLANDSGVMAHGSYTGNGSDDRSITGVGFKPDIVFVFNDVSGESHIVRTKDMAGDLTAGLNQSAADAANKVQSLDSDGFTIGSHNAVNSNTKVYYWLAFKITESGAINANVSTATIPISTSVISASVSSISNVNITTSTIASVVTVNAVSVSNGTNASIAVSTISTSFTVISPSVSVVSYIAINTSTVNAKFYIPSVIVSTNQSDGEWTKDTFSSENWSLISAHPNEWSIVSTSSSDWIQKR